MDTESSSTIDSFLTIPSLTNNNNVALPPPLTAKASTGSLCRMGSGTSSVVIDSENRIEAESRKLPFSKYKGVVPQPNGRWGAQIYDKHQRVWLGTFNEEDEAARSYDVAALRFRGGDAVTNFKPLSPDDESGAAELRFSNSRAKAEIVDMLKKHTYYDELQQSRRNLVSGSFERRTSSSSDMGNMTRRDQLFEKVVTPSDVGKLNRLVIPKQHAEKHFPLTSPSSKGVLLNLEDVNDKVWRFRYSYWNSSQSYVLTKGWSRFVKEKNLKAGDVVCFLRSTGPDKQLHIDWKPRSGAASIGSRSSSGSDEEVIESPVAVHPAQILIRLFGVDISKVPTSK